MCYLLSFTMRSDIFTKPLVRFNIVVCTNMFYLDLHVSEVWRMFFFIYVTYGGSTGLIMTSTSHMLRIFIMNNEISQDIAYIINYQF